ncbi:MAG: lysoplasmalogenase [Rubrivivax sp.]
MASIPVAALALATSVTATLAILSAPWALGLPWLNFVFKPLTTLLIIAYAWPRGATTPVRRRWVLAGLALSLCGDVALLWPQQGFLPGLVSFLLAHLAYLFAFTREGVRLAARSLPFVLYGVLAAVILWQLWPGVPAGLRLPVLAYVLCLASMAAQAAVVGLMSRSTVSQRAGAVLALGGALFLASDALLASNKFAGPLPLAGLWILCTYWLAQWCIASWLPPRTHMPLNKPV